MKINCLVQVNGNSELDFAEWLDYHIALGFDTIHVFDSGNKVWLDSVCERRRDHVVRVPRKDDWQYKSTIISEYVSRVHEVEWCVCLDEHDFIYIDPRVAKNIRDYIARAPERALALTLYTRHMSSEKPMKNRVGTQLDCFIHARREPEGFMPPYAALPNTGITFFKIVGPGMPMKNPIVPANTALWVDAMMSPMSEQRLTAELGSTKFSPMHYPARIYRYAIRSGIEMEFKDDLIPNGFDILDLSMQQARERFLRIPVNAETETLFAKDTLPEPEVKVESADGKKYEMSADELAENSLPITRARIDKLILKGLFFEDICSYVTEKYGDFDRNALERVFHKEREAIIKSSPLYTEMQELIDEGRSDEEIKRTLVIKDTTLEAMKKALKILDIRTNVKEVEVTGSEALDLATQLTIVTDKDTSVVDSFNASVESHRMTPLQQAAIDAEESAKREKRKSKSARKKKEFGAQSAKKVVAVKAVAMQVIPSAPSEDGSSEPMADDDGEFKLNMEETNDAENV